MMVSRTDFLRSTAILGAVTLTAPGVFVEKAMAHAVTVTYEDKQEGAARQDRARRVAQNDADMGLAGFDILRDANESSLRVPATAGAAPVLPSHPYEMPVVIHDRMLAADGGLAGPSGPPELPLGMVLVNGEAWPRLDVEPRKYRLRVLNGSESRTFSLRFEAFAGEDRIEPGEGTPVPAMVIGTDLGMLDAPALTELAAGPGLPAAPGVLAIGPGERYDVIVDFANLAAGSRVAFTDTARSLRRGAAQPQDEGAGRLLAFGVVVPLNKAVPDATVQIGTRLRPITGALPVPATTDTVPVRRILLFEGSDALGRPHTMVGPVDADPVTGQQGTLILKDPVTERPRAGTTEIWEFYNTAVDARPMRMHLGNFRILDRQTFTGTLTPKLNSDGSGGAVLDPASIVRTGAALPASAWEAGEKDTVTLFPGEVTRVLATFDREGDYVYHCPLLSHEDRATMRPYEVV